MRIAIKAEIAADGHHSGSIRFDVGPQRINEFGNFAADGTIANR